MTPPKKDLAGLKYGHLTVLSFAGRDKWRRALWTCKCDCPEKVITVVAGFALTSNKPAQRTCGRLCELNLLPKLSDLVHAPVLSPPGRDWISFALPLLSGEEVTVIVDRDVLPKISNYRWTAHYAGASYYVHTTFAAGTLFLHRVILGLQKGDKLTADHYNGNGLDNTRRIDGVGNIHIVTSALNAQNVSRAGRELPRGVYKQRRGWRAALRHKGQFIDLGTYLTVTEADAAAIAGRAKYFPNSNEDRKKRNY